MTHYIPTNTSLWCEEVFGTAVGDEKDAYINTHFRRFLRKDELLKELEGLGFIIEFVDERDGVAALGDDNPVVLRVHARK
jgi:bifunctional enzyme CysN/CysC